MVCFYDALQLLLKSLLSSSHPSSRAVSMKRLSCTAIRLNTYGARLNGTTGTPRSADLDLQLSIFPRHHTRSAGRCVISFRRLIQRSVWLCRWAPRRVCPAVSMPIPLFPDEQPIYIERRRRAARQPAEEGPRRRCNHGLQNPDQVGLRHMTVGFQIISAIRRGRDDAD